MKNRIAFLLAALCLFLSACHRPVAYFGRTSHPAAARLPVDQPASAAKTELAETNLINDVLTGAEPEVVTEAVASVQTLPSQSTHRQLAQRIHRVQSMVEAPVGRADKQPDPRPKNKLRLGNRIRQGLGLPLRKELNWWQRISWKLKASVIVILVAVVFAILHITTLAIIFGIVGVLLMISGLKRSFKVRRPWF